MSNIYMNVDDAYDNGTLTDWYITSLVNPEKPPVWTEEHIEELLDDFYVIPKSAAKTEIVRCGECIYKKEWIKNGMGEYFCRRSGLWNLTDACFCHCGTKSL